MAEIRCPICGYHDHDEYVVRLHIEETHNNDASGSSEPESSEPSSSNASSSIPQRASNQSSDDDWLKCTRPSCGEYVHIADIDEHIDMHDAIAAVEAQENDSDTERPQPSPPESSSSARPDRPLSSPRDAVIRSGEQDRSSTSHRDTASRSNVQDRSSTSHQTPASRSSRRHRSSTPPRDTASRSSRQHRSSASPQDKASRSSRQGRSSISPRARPKSSGQQRSPQTLQKRQQQRTQQAPQGYTLLFYFAGTSYHGSSRPSQSSSSTRPKQHYRKLQRPHEPGRLGKRELGPYAFEETMPSSVRRQLLNDAVPYAINRIGRDGRLERHVTVENETAGIIPVLADICALDEATEKTYLCHPATRHVRKILCDGNFCGYWNIQMLLTFLWRRFEDRRGDPRPVEDVLRIQETIEAAWDAGICPYGRVETGGVKNTRKWIGTHEALAYFTQIGIEVDALAFQQPENASSGDDSAPAPPAAIALLDHVEAYFIGGLDEARRRESSYITRLPPLYFQRLGHSMTIVGLERRKDGRRNLLVFDPSFGTTRTMSRLIDGKHARVLPETLSDGYRRSDESLMRWEEFEIIVPRVKD